jgi:hypothetical protein
LDGNSLIQLPDTGKIGENISDATICAEFVRPVIQPQRTGLTIYAKVAYHSRRMAMPKRFQKRSVGTIMALVIFTTTINCYCGIIHPAHQNDACQSSCCEPDNDGCHDDAQCSQSQPKPVGRNNGDHQCLHCLGFLTIEKGHIQTSQFRPQLFPIQPLAMDIAGLHLPDSAVASANSALGLSPEIASPTLLRLHCAHTI